MKPLINRVRRALSLLLFSLTPPLTAIGAWLWMDEPLSMRSWLAMAITLAGVAWVLCERVQTTQSSTGHHHCKVIDDGCMPVG